MNNRTVSNYNRFTATKCWLSMYTQQVALQGRLFLSNYFLIGYQGMHKGGDCICFDSIEYRYINLLFINLKPTTNSYTANITKTYENGALLSLCHIIKNVFKFINISKEISRQKSLLISHHESFRYITQCISIIE